ncbi:MAG: hypothetical protein GWO16_09950 [Gammaproteobacteria bacterium]|nr:hypothetical protein [Gammaproteobacteria bacterium]NIR98848.1 hypothetical protein [Gammaproteobacteria bacterium]NIT63969.1 hypothetical protein [Gammaproteobacteria bacterium]NIV19129.1 hypothetical protein [Gammaproteobacteria bacterium]NIX10298.1 hypothetical protein [Gammaproteobacteria bacterium]
MQSMATWEIVLLGIVLVLVLLWVRPGIRGAFRQSREAENKDWAGVLLPIAAVLLFVIMVIYLAAG